MRISILKVKGNSMHPTLESGAFVFVWYSKQLFEQAHLCHKLPIIGSYLASTIALNVGDIVAVNHPKYGQIIKRIAQIDEVVSGYDDQQYRDLKKTTTDRVQSTKSLLKSSQLKRIKLRGDNLMHSVSEDAMGWVSTDHIIGKVMYIVNR